MNLLPSKMTRRKQNAPKRLKSTDKSGCSPVGQSGGQTCLATSDSGIGEGDEAEDEEEEDEEEDDEDTAASEEDYSLRGSEEGDVSEIAGSGETVVVVSEVSERSVDILDEQAGDRPDPDKNCTHSLESSDATEMEPSRNSPVAGFVEHEIPNFLEPPTSKESIIKTEANLEDGRERTARTLQASVSPDGPGTKSRHKIGAPPHASSRYKYSGRLSPPLLSTTTAPLSSIERQIKLVMSSLPPGLLPKVASSSSPPKAVESTFKCESPGLADDQPLDLSRKCEKSEKVPTHSGKAPVPISTSTTSNGFSSLQSLQQRFGGDFPLGLPQQKSSASIIAPLQSCGVPKSAAAHQSLPNSTDASQHAGATKMRLGARSDWCDKEEAVATSTLSPMLKGSSSNRTSPFSMLADEPSPDSGNKHTIHKCSCQKSFSSLYHLSLHLQETGHAPSSSKSTSLMDYPKLVRGQDMWLNQESEQTRRILRCMQCGESFKSLPLLTVHMMQTQHYTKIVSSDHGRRSHKCSTYCDRELDRECIFKCKVCQETFTDMEGLANHMLMSGHHRKQSSRQFPSPADIASDLSSMVKHGKRKRFFPDEVPAEICPSAMSSLLEYKFKPTVTDHAGRNGFSPEAKNLGKVSPDFEGPRMVACDSCGRHLESQDFELHIRACLRQRAEVIEALRSKLAAEEALLSRSESRLLRSGFRLTSASDLRDVLIKSTSSLDKERNPSDDQLSFFGCKLELGPMDIPKRGHSGSASPGRTHSSPGAGGRLQSQANESRAKICDLFEVPLKKWYCASDSAAKHLQDRETRGSSETRHAKTSDKLNNTAEDGKEDNKHERSLMKEFKDHIDPCVRVKRKITEVEPETVPASPIRKKDRPSPDLLHSIKEDATDFSSSALHKLDVFSRGLKFSPPRRNISPDTKPSGQHPSKAGKKKESALSISKSSALGSSISQLKSETCEPPRKDVTFDIIDPNADLAEVDSSASALEAMESFINKSFSAKSDLRSSNLASMFSPFRSCFPLPGLIPVQNNMLPDSTDRAFSHFAKFSKFFRMVPGAAQLPETGENSQKIDRQNSQSASPSPVPEPGQIPPHSRSLFLNKTLPLTSSPSLSSSMVSSSVFSKVKVPDVKHPFYSIPHDLGRITDPGPAGKKLDNSLSSRKYKYSIASVLDSATSISHHGNHSPSVSRATGHLNTEQAHCHLAEVSNSPLKKPNVFPDLELSKKRRVEDRKYNEVKGIKEEVDKLNELDNNNVEDNQESRQICDTRHFDPRVTAQEDLELRVTAQSESLGQVAQTSVSDVSLRHSPNCQPGTNPHLEAGKPGTNPHVEAGNLSDQKRIRDVNEVDCFFQNNIQVQTNLEKRLYSPQKDLLLEVARTMKMEDNSDGDENSVAVDDGEHGSYKDIELRLYKAEESKDSSLQLRTSSLKVFYETRGDNGSQEIDEAVAKANSHNSDGDVDTDDGGVDSELSRERCVQKRCKERRRLKHKLSDMNKRSCEKQVPAGVDHQRLLVVKTEDNIDTSTGSPVCSELGPVLSSDLSPAIQLKETKELSRNSGPDLPASQSADNFPEKHDHEREIKLEQELATNSDSRHHSPGISRGNLYSRSPEDHTTKSDKHPDSKEENRLFLLKNGKENSKLPNKSDHLKASHKNSHKRRELVDKEGKRSALDSLSSFVYSQPLASEHPLDSLHKLLSTTDLPHVISDPHKLVATANQIVPPGFPASLTLTSKAGSAGAAALMTCPGFSSDENEEGDPALADGGGTSEGDMREYKCAACNRQFASKGSYRYHLSRCHLSSVQKYGIKEAFNMSPYVYLPLDHTAKFSKYYQLAHELANKGK